MGISDGAAGQTGQWAGSMSVCLTLGAVETMLLSGFETTLVPMVL